MRKNLGKRTREEMMVPTPPFSGQLLFPQPATGTHHSSLVSTGLCLSLDEQQQFQINQNNNSSLSTKFSRELAAQIARQNNEIELFLIQQVCSSPLNLLQINGWTFNICTSFILQAIMCMIMVLQGFTSCINICLIRAIKLPRRMWKYTVLQVVQVLVSKFLLPLRLSNTVLRVPLSGRTTQASGCGEATEELQRALTRRGGDGCS